MSNALKVVAGVAVVVVVAGAVWFFAIRSDAPPAVTATECPDAAAAPSDAPSGTWTVVAGDPSFVGYRMEEVFGGGSVFDQVAVGQTTALTGELVLDDGDIDTVTVTADVTQLESDKARRDNFLKSEALQTETFGEATFTLTEPITIDPASGCVNTEASGQLTLHGQMLPVVVPVSATWDGEAIEVTGSAPIVLADYAIEPANVAGLVTVADDGVMEFTVRFAPPA